MKYDERMDKECVALCDALNLLPGISTFESCCGHGEREFHVWFFADQVAHLLPIEQGLDHQWHIEATHVDLPTRIAFLLEGPNDSKAGDALAPYIHESTVSEEPNGG